MKGAQVQELLVSKVCGSGEIIVNEKSFKMSLKAFFFLCGKSDLISNLT